MTTITAVEPEAASGEAAELLDQVQRAMGRVPNMTKVMASSPTLLKSYLALSTTVGGGTLSPAVRQRLAIISAQLNGCEYCLSAHTYIGEHLTKLPQAELDAARQAQSSDPHVEALLGLSKAITENAGAVPEAEIDEARAAGVTDAEIGEVVANVALNVLTNYFNVLAGVANDWPVVEL